LIKTKDILQLKQSLEGCPVMDCKGKGKDVGNGKDSSGNKEKGAIQIDD
jgi:hypothetical protein